MTLSSSHQHLGRSVSHTWMICAACSGVPWRRSCSLTANTRSLLRSLPSLAARPPSSRSSTNTPDSSVRRTSLMPSCSLESRLCSVILSVAGLEGAPSGVEQGAWGTAGVDEEEEGGAREAQRRSRSTVSCRVVQGRASVERAKLWGTLLMSTLFTWGRDKQRLNIWLQQQAVNTTVRFKLLSCYVIPANQR